MNTLKTHLLTLRDDTEYRITEEKFQLYSQAIDNKRNFYVEDDYITWSDVRGIKRILSSAERPVLQLREPDLTESQLTRIGESKRKIREKLESLDPSEKHRREYLEEVTRYRANNNKYIPL